MGGFFDRITGRKQSAKNAKERLQLVLIHDRTDMTQIELEALRDDILAVISRHVDIDPGAVRIDVEREGSRIGAAASSSSANGATGCSITGFAGGTTVVGGDLRVVAGGSGWS